MVENVNKLQAAFLAGRMDAMTEQRRSIPEGVEELLRMVLSESDCASLTRLRTALFHRREEVGLRLLSPVTLLPVGTRNSGSNGGNLEAS